MLGNLNKQMESDIARGNTIRILADAIFHFAICFLLINKGGRGNGGVWRRVAPSSRRWSWHWRTVLSPQVMMFVRGWLANWLCISRCFSSVFPSSLHHSLRHGAFWENHSCQHSILGKPFNFLVVFLSLFKMTRVGATAMLLEKSITFKTNLFSVIKFVGRYGIKKIHYLGLIQFHRASPSLTICVGIRLRSRGKSRHTIARPNEI